MGACGCGDFSGDLVFPAPDGDVYVLDVYPGCADCDAPAGVVLHRFTREEAERWGVAGRKPLEIGQDGTGIPVMDASVLRRFLVKEVTDGLTEYAKEVVADGLRGHFRDAALKTYAGWEKQRQKRAAEPAREGRP